MDAIRSGCVIPYFSPETWTEFDVALERFGTRYRLKSTTTQAIRSLLVDRREMKAVDAVDHGLRDPTDDPLLDVLEQTAAEWLCTDDSDLHAAGRPDVLGVGELVRLIEEVCRADAEDD